MKAFWDWGYLIVFWLLCSGSFIAAGVWTKNLALQFFGYMFVLIGIIVFSTEAVTYFFLPQHITISNSFGIFMSGHPVAGWLLLSAWIAFAWSLAVHLASRKQVHDDK